MSVYIWGIRSKAFQAAPLGVFRVIWASSCEKLSVGDNTSLEYCSHEGVVVQYGGSCRETLRTKVETGGQF